METINQKRKLLKQIRELVDSASGEKEFHRSFIYCEGKGMPVFTFTIEKKEENHFIDENGQKWVKASS